MQRNQLCLGTEIDTELSYRSESSQEIVAHLEAHYPHLMPKDMGTIGWIEAALLEDRDAVGLSVGPCTSDEELVSLFWQSRRWVRDGYELLNDSLQDEWDAFEELRPLFPEVRENVSLPLAA